MKRSLILEVGWFSSGRKLALIRHRLPGRAADFIVTGSTEAANARIVDWFAPRATRGYRLRIVTGSTEAANARIVDWFAPRATRGYRLRVAEDDLVSGQRALASENRGMKATSTTFGVPSTREQSGR